MIKKLLAIGCASAALTLTSHAVTIGFDELTDGELVTSQYSALGVLFSTHWVVDGHSEPSPLGYPDYLRLGGVGFHSYCSAPEYVQADFSVPVSSVSIQMQPFEGGTFTFGLQLFDSSGLLLDALYLTRVSNSHWDSVDPNDRVTLGLSANANVASARFYGYNEYGVNAVSFDNFCFDGASVPEVGSTLYLFGIALAGIVGLRNTLFLGQGTQ